LPHFDIYAEIAKVCPSQSDLRGLPNDEITLRINSLNQHCAQSGRTFSKLDGSPYEGEMEEAVESEEKCYEFGIFGQPSIKNFMENIDESSSLWNNIE
jgi:hypothetical protein